MRDFVQLLKRNRNYRATWTGQLVSEIGDHFNNIAVFSLALAHTRSGLVVTGIMLARAIPVRFCDLPQAVSLAEALAPKLADKDEDSGDPIQMLAQAAGEASNHAE